MHVFFIIFFLNRCKRKKLPAHEIGKIFSFNENEIFLNAFICEFCTYLNYWNPLRNFYLHINYMYNSIKFQKGSKTRTAHTIQQKNNSYTSRCITSQMHTLTRKIHVFSISLIFVLCIVHHLRRHTITTQNKTTMQLDMLSFIQKKSNKT